MKIAVYPGSFDPISNGHIDIIKRAARLVDKLYVLVSINPNKKYVFNVSERVEMVKIACEDISNVEVSSSSALVLNYAKSINATMIIRGIRNHNDFDNEMQLFQFNHTINDNIETLLMFPSANNLFLSSSSIKELVLFGSDISPYVPNSLEKEIISKIKERVK